MKKQLYKSATPNKSKIYAKNREIEHCAVIRFFVKKLTTTEICNEMNNVLGDIGPSLTKVNLNMVVQDW